MFEVMLELLTGPLRIISACFLESGRAHGTIWLPGASYKRLSSHILGGFWVVSGSSWERPGAILGASWDHRDPKVSPQSAPKAANLGRELQSDLGIQPPPHGNLENWAKAGVLLLNSCLTVADGQAAAHAGKGWERFTDAVIDQLNQHKHHLVFILWGRKAQEKGAKINRDRHLVIASAHPSPLAAHNGFFGSAPFSKTNNYLRQHGITPINWDVTADY